MKVIKLTHGEEAFVDDDIFEIVNQISFHLKDDNYAAWQNKKGFKPETMYLHHYVIGWPLNRSNEIDHINGNGLDNRRENLRIVSKRDNAINRKFNRDGHLPGASITPYKKWRAVIWINGRSNHIGSFKTEKEASDAYFEYRRKNGI